METHIESFNNSKIFSCEVYVINYNNTVIVIDLGFYDGDLKEYLNKLGKIDTILLTHGHGDHIRCVDQIVKDYPKTKVYIHPFDKELLSNPELNCSSWVGDEDIKVASDVKLIEQGNYNFGELKVQVIHVPGHTDGGVMYYFDELSALFLGDTVIGESIGNLQTPTGDINKMQASLGKFKHLGIDLGTICYPGHGEVMSYGEILRVNPFLNGNF